MENPLSSFLWHIPELVTLAEQFTIVDLHQCVFGLRPPDHYLQVGARQDLRTRKATRIITNVQGLSRLGCKCQGGHIHVQALGSVKYRGQTVSRARAAGACPSALCSAWAGFVDQHANWGV